MKGWSANHIERLKQKGMVGEQSAPKQVVKIPKVKHKDPEALRHIKEMLGWLNIPFETEYMFHPTRKFRFDVAIKDQKIAIEYEGIISDTSRHTTIEGYTNDARKYNLAQIEGWKVLRYTAANYKEFVNEIKSLL